MSTLHPSFLAAIERTHAAMRDYSRPIHTHTWQGVDISRRPEAEMREMINWDFRVPMPGENLDHYRRDIQPNLPWADDHFKERVCGYPMNPGSAWLHWPWAQSAGNFLTADDGHKFEINYMERYWCANPNFQDSTIEPLVGIRGRPYGDLQNIISLLTKEPHTRQAYLPVYFPEDTGAGGRVPCSLGYHWLMRNNFLHVFYPIRSCDYLRHFRDDIYLTCRLTLWLLSQLRRDTEAWRYVRPGYFSIWIGSLHIFVNDYVKLYGRVKETTDGSR